MKQFILSLLLALSLNAVAEPVEFTVREIILIDAFTSAMVAVEYCHMGVRFDDLVDSLNAVIFQKTETPILKEELSETLDIAYRIYEEAYAEKKLTCDYVKEIYGEFLYSMKKEELHL